MISEDQRSDQDSYMDCVPGTADGERRTVSARPIGVGLAEVLTGWFFGRNAPATDDEHWLQKRFKYWAQQLRHRFYDPEGELLSELALKNEPLDVAQDRGYAECMLRSACLDILRREQGRGAARNAKVCTDDLSRVAPSVAPNQIKHLELMQKLDELVRLSPRCAEALELKTNGLSDEDACKRSKWPCTPAAFRQRVHNAREQLLKIDEE